MNKLFIALQYLIPHHALSRFVGLLTRCRWPWLKNAVIDGFVRCYKVDMQEAVESDTHAYPDFNSFFTRALRSDIRPIAQDADAVACPIDGRVQQIGRINGGTLLQAKGHDFDLSALLGGSEDLARQFAHGSFATLYLAPKDYHRVHMPLTGTLVEMIHVPGRLFSVNPITADGVPNLFARNERVISIFDTTLGKMAVILVGAMIVASIETVWAGTVTPPHGRQIREWRYNDDGLIFTRGQEIGRFKLGSTVILLFPEKSVAWLPEIKAAYSIKIGQQIGRIHYG